MRVAKEFKNTPKKLTSQKMISKKLTHKLKLKSMMFYNLHWA